MATPYGRIPTRQPTQRIQDYVEGNTISYENSDFQQGGSPIILNFQSDSGGRICHTGYLINDGPGDLQFEFSNDGTSYGGIHTMKPGDQLDLMRFNIATIRLTWVENTGYRALLA